MTAAAVGLSAVAHAMTIAGGSPAVAPVAAPPTRLGVSIQQSLADRDRDMATRMRAATLREQSARATEQRLKADVESRQGQIDAQAKVGAASVDPQQPLEDLARIYQTMKPARAAAIFAALDLDVQTQVAKRMRERSIALIMANMDPSAAVRLSMSLAGRRPPPPPAPVPQLAAFDPRTQPASIPSRPRMNLAYAGNDRGAAAPANGPSNTRPRAPAVSPAVRVQAPSIQPPTAR